MAGGKGGHVGVIDVVLRPRRSLAVVVIAATLILPIALFALEYSAAFFDARTVLIAVYGVAASVVLVSARVVVGEGRVSRELGKRRPSVVALDALAMVSLRRRRTARQPWPTVRLAVADREGNRIELRPALWTGGARALLATVEVAARVQAIDVDDETRARLAEASSRSGSAAVPGWAYHASLARADEAGVRETDGVGLPQPSSRPRRASPKAAAASLAALGVVVPTLLFLTAKGTAAVRSSRCRAERASWTVAPDEEAPGVNVQAWAGTVGRVSLGDATHSFYALAAGDIAGPGNTIAVRHDAESLRGGANVVWRSASGTEIAEEHYERFATADDAARFQRDWGEDHCHSGDLPFGVPGIQGAVGLRCTCGRGVRVDRVGFVQGAVRFQTIVFGLTSRSDHSRALLLATNAHNAAVAGALTPLDR